LGYTNQEDAYRIVEKTNHRKGPAATLYRYGAFSFSTSINKAAAPGCGFSV
jgi:hypothetical protein